LITLQSEPPLLVLYASSLPSSLKEMARRLTVPSSEKVLGSSSTLASAPSEACVHSTYCACRPELW
jgi:hypothetical protein